MTLFQLRRLFAPTVRKINGLIVRGAIYKVDDSGPVQKLQIGALATELRDKIERLQNYGFASSPPPGTEALFVCKNGERGNMVAIATDHRSLRRKSLKLGESVQYNAITGAEVFLDALGDVTVKAAVDAVLHGLFVKLGGKAANDPVARKSDLEALAATFNLHTHEIPDLPTFNTVPVPPPPGEEPAAVIAEGGITSAPTTPQTPTASTMVFLN